MKITHFTIEDIRSRLHTTLKEIASQDKRTMGCTYHPKQWAEFFDTANAEPLCYDCACSISRKIKKRFSHARKDTNI